MTIRDAHSVNTASTVSSTGPSRGPATRARANLVRGRRRPAPAHPEAGKAPDPIAGFRADAWNGSGRDRGRDADSLAVYGVYGLRRTQP
jgi:hypothetical protein